MLAPKGGVHIRFVPLLEPLAEAILAHQNKAALRHADETSWRVQELRGEDRSSRAWLWVSVSNDAVSFHIDPSRSAEAAQKLFGDALLDTVIVCDRYSAYKRFVPLLEPLAEAILAHQNKAALRHADETSWRVQELRGEDRSSRAWLWVSVSNVSFHIDPSRSAEAAQKLFGDALLVPYAPRFCRVRGRPAR